MVTLVGDHGIRRFWSLFSQIPRQSAELVRTRLAIRLGRSLELLIHPVSETAWSKGFGTD